MNRRNNDLMLNEERTTLERDRGTIQKNTIKNNGPDSILLNSISNNHGSQRIAKKAMLPYQRRNVKKLKSTSPPKMNLKLCTENYIVYS